MLFDSGRDLLGTFTAIPASRGASWSPGRGVAAFTAAPEHHGGTRTNSRVFTRCREALSCPESPLCGEDGMSRTSTHELLTLEKRISNGRSTLGWVACTSTSTWRCKDEGSPHRFAGRAAPEHRRTRGDDCRPAGRQRRSLGSVIRATSTASRRSRANAVSPSTKAGLGDHLRGSSGDRGRSGEASDRGFHFNFARALGAGASIRP